MTFVRAGLALNRSKVSLLQFDRPHPHFSLEGFEYGNCVCTESAQRIPCRRRAPLQHCARDAALLRPAPVQRTRARQRFFPAIFSAGVSRSKRSADHDSDRAKDGAHDRRGQRFGGAIGKSRHGRALGGAGRPPKSHGLHHAQRLGPGPPNSSGNGGQFDEDHGISFAG